MCDSADFFLLVKEGRGIKTPHRARTYTKLHSKSFVCIFISLCYVSRYFSKKTRLFFFSRYLFSNIKLELVLWRSIFDYYTRLCFDLLCTLTKFSLYNIFFSCLRYLDGKFDRNKNTMKTHTVYSMLTKSSITHFICIIGHLEMTLTSS